MRVVRAEPRRGTARRGRPTDELSGEMTVSRRRHDRCEASGEMGRMETEALTLAAGVAEQVERALELLGGGPR